MAECLRWARTLALLFACCAGSALAQPAATKWSFTLLRNATTSAGIYTPDGRLLRTLWRGEASTAGIHRGEWDGRDDRGATVPAGDYEMRVLHHRISYVWEGTIGNSSGEFGGPRVHKAYLPPASIAIAGDRAFYAVGFNEQQTGLHGFLLASPQFDTRPTPARDPFAAVSMVAVDAKRVYWANTGGFSRTSFVAAYERLDMKPSTFSAGKAICLNWQTPTRCYYHQDYPSVVDVETQESMAPTGLAVQENGPLLAIAHGGAGSVRLFDKLTGLRRAEIAVPLAAKALNQIAFTPTGDLWVLSGRRALRYTNVATQPTLATSIETLVQPLAIAASPSGESVWIADGGSSQQVKQFDPTGRAGLVIGQAGGYASDPAVGNARLCFIGREGPGQTAIGVTPTQLWVVDYCNNRMLRFPIAANAVSDAQIAYLPGFYASTVDLAQPRRVFANYLEFEADTETPWQPASSWKLVRNWLGGAPAALRDKQSFNATYGGFRSVVTLSSGRTYGIVEANRQQVLVELPASGPMRSVKVFAAPLPGATGRVMYENGDLGWSLTGPSRQSAMRLPLVGFDERGDPRWADEPVVLASVPTAADAPWVRPTNFTGLQPPRFPLTGSGNVVFFDSSVFGNEGFHLGAARRGSTDWLWQASPTGPLDGKGTYQTRAVDGSLQYAGNMVWAVGRHIVYGFHGEFYKDLQTGNIGQANQFMHFDESGLFLGQFGQPSTRPGPPNQAGLSGNAFSPTLLRIGSNLYLYHNDESSHGGVHRWRIDGWNDVQELRGRGRMGGEILLL